MIAIFKRSKIDYSPSSVLQVNIYLPSDKIVVFLRWLLSVELREPRTDLALVRYKYRQIVLGSVYTTTVEHIRWPTHCRTMSSGRKNWSCKQPRETSDDNPWLRLCRWHDRHEFEAMTKEPFDINRNLSSKISLRTTQDQLVLV